MPEQCKFHPVETGGSLIPVWKGATGGVTYMTLEYVISGLIALGLLVYLLFALLKPERF
jgi:K+-transporting ATPase KdpF subunit